MTCQGERKEVPQHLVDVYLGAFDAWLRNPTGFTLGQKTAAFRNILVWRWNNDRRAHTPRRIRSRKPITDRRRRSRRSRI